jgi:hypothetical protein
MAKINFKHQTKKRLQREKIAIDRVKFGMALSKYLKTV